MSSYLDAILSGQSQRKATGGGALTPGQVEAAAQGDIAARYQAGAASRALNIAQQNADTQARAEAAQEEEYYAGLGERTSEFTTTSGFTQQGLDIQKQQQAIAQKTLEGQQSAEKTSAMITGAAVAAYGIPKIAPYAEKLYTAAFSPSTVDTTTNIDPTFFNQPDATSSLTSMDFSFMNFDMGSDEWIASLSTAFDSWVM